MAFVMIPNAVLAQSPTASSSASPPAETKPVEKDGLSVTVSMERRAIPADEQPSFVLRFKNTSNGYINLYGINAFWGWQIRFANINKPAGNPGPWKLRFDTIPGRRHYTAHKQVKPGESTEVAINLNDPPYTFNYVYDGVADHLIAPVRSLSPGAYRLEVNVALKNPFGPGHHEWTGPVTTEPVEFTVDPSGSHGLGSRPTKEEISAYDQVIQRVTGKLDPHAWMNGSSGEVKLPAGAKLEDVIALAVNKHSLESKAYRILRVRQVDRPKVGASAALMEVGAKTKVLIFFPEGKEAWWTRFYDTALSPPAAQPGAPPSQHALPARRTPTC
jgi:hypothetical protein